MNPKRIRPTLPAAAFAGAFAAAFAAGPGTAHARSERIEVQGQTLRAADAQAAAALRGRYVLEDGRVLEVAVRGRQLRVALDGGADQTLLMQSATQARSADGRLQLRFRAAANGSVDQVRLVRTASAAQVALR